MRNLRYRLPISLISFLLAVTVLFSSLPYSVSAEESFKIYCTGSSVRVRDAASLSSNVLGYLDNDQAVTLLEDSYNSWAYIETSSGLKGYTSTRYLNKSEDSQVSMSGYATENINVYSDKSSGSQSVGSIKSGESVTVTDNSDCDWAKVQLTDGTSGYVNQDLFIVELKKYEAPSFTPEETPNINSQITSNMFAGDFVLLENSVTLKEGETYLISPTLSTNYGASGLMYYNSSDNDVASVSSVGRITANNEGQAVITVTSPFSEKSQSMSITVEKDESNTEPTTEPTEETTESGSSGGDFEILETAVSVYVGESYSVKVFGDTDLSWKSSNESVATVSGGTIYGKSSGEATITAYNGSYEKSFKVTVTTPSSGGSISHTYIEIPAGKSYMVSCSGSDAVWSSDNTSIAQVDWDPVGTSSYVYIEGQNPGTTVIRGKSSKGNVSCMVKVTEAAPQRFAYTSPNSGYSGGVMTFIAITGKEQQAVKFEVSMGGENFTVYADEKTENGGTIIWKGTKTLYSPGKYSVVTYSQNKRGEWETCSDGVTDAFVTSVDNPKTTVCEEHRTSDEGIALISNYEGFLSEVTIDSITGKDPTLGYGKVVGVGSSFYNHITKPEGLAYLYQTVNLGYYSKAVNNYLISNGVKFNQQQYDALVSMVYNLGSGVLYDSDVMDVLIYGSGSSETGTPSVGDTGTINGTYVAFREGPSTNYNRIREFELGEKVTLLSGSTDDWYHVRNSYGTEGYLYASYVTFAVATGRDLNNVDEEAMKEVTLVYHHAGTTCYWGLLYRRIDEMEIFFHGDYILDGRNNKYGYHYYCHLDSSFGVG